MKIVYVCYNESTPHWPMCRESVYSWCEKMGAEVVNLPKPETYQPQWVLFDAFQHSIDNDVTQAIWIDCDIIIQKFAPDIFEELPDKLFFCQPDPPYRIHRYMEEGWKRFGALNPRPYVVTGIALWSPRHVKKISEWFREEITKTKGHKRFFRKHTDQELLTVALQETETYHAYFPPHYHKMTGVITADCMMTTPFLHAAGVQKKRKLEVLRLIESLHDGSGTAPSPAHPSYRSVR